MFEWHEEELRSLLTRRERLPHAVLVRGPQGTGIDEFARTVSQSLLCEAPAEGRACGRCAACGWFELGNHPDYRLVQPDSFAPEEEEEGEAPRESGARPRPKSDQIRIDQIRALQAFLAVGTHRAGLRVVVLHPADAMNPATQNALLKSLEEPPAQTLFLLVSSSPHRLLPTVLSRCQPVDLPRPAPARAVRWLAEQGVREPEAALALAGGAPLLAAEMAERAEFIAMFTERLADRGMEPLALAAACQNAAPAEFVASLYRWCYDLLCVGLAGRVRYHRGREPALRELAALCRPQRTAAYLRALAEAASLAQHPLNVRLFYEDLLLRYHALVEPPRPALSEPARKP